MQPGSLRMRADPRGEKVPLGPPVFGSASFEGAGAG